MFDVRSLPTELNILDRYQIQIRGRLTQVTGLSASGKSMLCNLISDINSDIKFNKSIYPDIYYDLVEYNAEKDNIKISDLESLKGKFIFIDRADFLDSCLVDYIKYDKLNCYILFARSYLGLGISPNYICELEDINGIIYTSYKFSEVGWF